MLLAFGASSELTEISSCFNNKERESSFQSDFERVRERNRERDRGTERETERVTWVVVSIWY